MVLKDSTRVHLFCNDGQRILFDSYYRATMQDDWSIMYHALPDPGAVNFGTQTFKMLIYRKICTLVDRILPAERNRPYFILSDVDIQFFGPCQALIERMMAENEMVLQSEDGNRKRPNANTGFIAMKSTPEVAAFWRQVRLRLQESIETRVFINEQTIVNELLPSVVDFRWTLFPDEIWAYSNKRLRPGKPGFRQICLHHANCTVPKAGRSSLELKLEQLQRVRHAFQTGEKGHDAFRWLARISSLKRVLEKPWPF